MKRIIASVDHSAQTDSVILCATSVAKAFSAQLILLHVADPEPDFVGFAPGPKTVRDARAEKFREHHRDLQRRAKDIQNQGVDAEAFLVQGSTIETILERAEHLQADLLILGSGGHGAVYRTLLGSTSEGVLRRAHIPVLVVPPRHEVRR